METWWNDFHNWNAAMDCYKLFRRYQQGRAGSGVALYVREGFECLELNDSDESQVFRGKNQGGGQQGRHPGGSLF